MGADADEAEAAFAFADLAEGREGAAVRPFEDGRLLMSDSDLNAEELFERRGWGTRLFNVR